MKERLLDPPPVLTPFQYSAATGHFSRPANISACLEFIQDPAARVVAGNTDLGIGTNLRGERYAHLVSVAALAELRDIVETSDGVEIGAALTLSEISARWSTAPAFFRDWLPLFASLPIRNLATLGGSLVTASPIGDSAPLLLALDASVRLISPDGERMVPLSEFFSGYRQTALSRGEILQSIRIPKPFPELIRFYKVAKRRMDDISSVAAGIAMSRDTTGRIRTARIGLGGVAATPWRPREAEDRLTGTQFDDADLSAAQASLRQTLMPIGDHRASAAYRLAMAQNLLAKFRHEVFFHAA
jgi:xanthine dehydrogenase small subunit